MERERERETRERGERGGERMSERGECMMTRFMKQAFTLLY
jgi:hypothetical protein